MDNTIQEVDHLARELAASLTSIAPTVWNTMCEIKRVDSIGTLTVSLIVFIITSSAFTYSVIKLMKCLIDDDFYEGREALYVVLVGILLIPTLFSGGNLLNVWNWVGVFDPSLAVAHDIATKVLH